MSGLFSTPLVLRDYQREAIGKLDTAITAGACAPLLVAPTGSGKTVMAASLIEREIARGGRPLFIAPRRELIRQASRTLREAGISHGVILAGADHLHAPDAPAQVASVDTLLSRLVRRGLLAELPRFSMVIVDEAHLVVTGKRIELLDCWPDAVRIGLTATPIRKDGRALGMVFDRLVEATTVQQLTEAGHLVPARYFSLSEPDLHRVRTVAGDFNAKDLDAAVNRPELVGDVVSHWLRYAPERRTVVFCTSIAHSIAVAEAFQRAGVATEHVDASTPTDERENTFQRFTRGDTQILTNCFLASYGFDLPALSCVVLARPTKSLMLFLQMLGRGLRPARGKADCLVLDHSGSVHRHGFAHDLRVWSLDGLLTLGDAARSIIERAESKQIDCPECSAVFSGTAKCPECGHRLTPKGRDVATLVGELVELGGKTTETIDRARFYAELRALQAERGYSPKWPAAQYRERFGEWPPFKWNGTSATVPSQATRRWIKSRQIAYAKSKSAAVYPDDCTQGEFAHVGR